MKRSSSEMTATITTIVPAICVRDLNRKVSKLSF